jgi:hypothetical protein
MCYQHRFPTSLLHLVAIVSAAAALTVFLCAPQSVAQITVGSVITAPDITQTVSGTCANYNAVLSSTGVSANGRMHPGQCRSTAITPLFDGIQLGTNMQAFFDSPNHPPLFKVQITHGKGRFCAVNSKLKVTLSASLQATRLQWTGNPVGGSMCTGEVMRVNAVSAPPSPVISPTVQAKVSTLLRIMQKELAQVPQMSGCGPTPAAATNSLDQQVWNRLQRLATHEVGRFEASVAPAIDTTNSCGAKCNLCFSGWVGVIQCTANANDSGYLWHELQTWDVGGPPTSGTGGSTNYPANFTSTGSGSKLNGPSWTINATKMGTLTDAGVNANKRFSTSNDTVAGGIRWNNTNQTSADGEMQVKFNADQVGGNTATTDPTPTLPSCINAQQKPAGVACTVACIWNLVNQ